MSIFRSYFLKNNSLISSNRTNNSQNPVMEISYGTENAQVSRFLFDIDLTDLETKIVDGTINTDRITKHVLHLTNTIRYAPEYIGLSSYSDRILRASGFDLEFFNIEEDWDEGTGYDFIYDDITAPNYIPPPSNIVHQASNWYDRKTGIAWSTAGAYPTGGTGGSAQIITGQTFIKGNEDIEVDITDYVIQRLGLSGYTGNTVYTGDSYGLGIKFTEYYESGTTELRQAVAFHAKNTNTYYEPYLETIVDDTITDDRNYFYLGKTNSLYLYVNIGNFPQDITVNTVHIYDYEGNIALSYSGSNIIHVKKGVYKINLNISPSAFPDAVLFTDVWNLTVNGRTVEHTGEFYLIDSENYTNFDNSYQMNFDNYHFNFWGISEKENLKAGITKKVKLSIKELYPNQNKFIPLDIEYRIFTTLGNKYEIDIIPFTAVNRTNRGYEFDIDTSWLIPQDYYLQIRLKNGSYYEDKQTLAFTVIADKLV